jgi:thiamine biosynthesis lipoprotein ApbE
MPYRTRLLLLVVGAWFAVTSSRPALGAEDFAFYHENVMGTSLELRVIARGPEAAAWAEAQVLGEIDRLSRIFSSYDATSEFRRWQATRNEPVQLSDELFDLLLACDCWRDRSGGAFDVRVEALSLLFGRAAQRKMMPAAGELAGARALMSSAAWRLDAESRTGTHLSDCPLSLNAIAKGYIIERACTLALEPGRGVLGVLLNVGGDLRVVGEAPRTLGIVSPWADSESSEPIALVEVKNRAVATSGRSQRGFRIEGKWHSHIFDARSGLPATGVASATVIAPRSADADALATIFNVLPPEESLRLAKTLPDVECLIVTEDGRTTRSEGWRRYEKAVGAPLIAAPVGVALVPLATRIQGDEPPAPAIASNARNPDFELVINFEINQPDGAGRRYRRPYVAIWVENKDGFPVRNLTLWVSMGGSGPFQWLPDLKRWYRADQARKEVENKDLVFTMARPTRPPGKYKVIWDGKDDHGKPVPAGEYTLFIDAAREHGTYQSIRKPLALADKPLTEVLKGNVEIKAASIEYRRKAATAAKVSQ